MFLDYKLGKTDGGRLTVLLDGITTDWMLMLTYKNGAPQSKEAAIIHCTDHVWRYERFHESDEHLRALRGKIGAILRQSPQYNSIDSRIIINEAVHVLEEMSTP